MSDEDVQKLLEDTLRSEHAPPLTDSVVDAFLATSVECSHESIDRMRARFVEKLFTDLHREPIKQVEDQPFGRWMEAERKRALLTQHDIANAINKDPSYIERIETGTVHLWNLSPNDIAKLVRLLRIHISALAQLVSNSFALSRARLAGDVIGRSHGGKATKERGDSVKRALDLYLAKNAKKEETSPEITVWLNELRSKLEDQQAADLLN